MIGYETAQNLLKDFEEIIIPTQKQMKDDMKNGRIDLYDPSAFTAPFKDYLEYLEFANNSRSKKLQLFFRSILCDYIIRIGILFSIKKIIHNTTKIKAKFSLILITILSKKLNLINFLSVIKIYRVKNITE